MSVNKIKILLSDTDKYVDIPVEMKWDFTGRDDSIEEYQKEMVKEIIGIVSSVFPKINNIHTINTIVQTATNSKKNLGIEVIKNL